MLNALQLQLAEQDACGIAGTYWRSRVLLGSITIPQPSCGKKLLRSVTSTREKKKTVESAALFQQKN